MDECGSLRQQQQLSVQPQVLLSVKLLNLSKMELLQYAQQAAIENPLLAWRQEEQDFPSKSRVSLGEDGEEWDEEYRYSQYSYDDYQQETLADFLQEQLVDLGLTPAQLSICRLLIACLDEKGYFCEDIFKVAGRFRLVPTEVEQMLELLRTLEPRGVAAASLEDCLCRQLDEEDPQAPLLKKLICNQLRELAQGRRKQVLAELQVDEGALARLLRQLQGFNPIPAQGFSTSKSTDYVVADWLVEPLGEDFQALPTEDWQLCLGEDFRYLQQQAAAAKDRLALRYVQEKKNQAEQLLQALSWRRRTLGQVADYLIRQEAYFFRHGISHIRPLTLAQAGAELSLHPATVSRALAHKYMQTPQGLLPAGYFFHSALPSPGGYAVSSLWIKHILTEILRREDKDHPYSDRKLAELIQAEQKLPLSRRTVAKYRQALGENNSFWR